MLEHFLKKNCKTKIKKNLELIKCILDGKDTLIHLIAGQIKRQANVELELSNFAARIDLKNATGADTSNLNTDLC